MLNTREQKIAVQTKVYDIWNKYMTLLLTNINATLLWSYPYQNSIRILFSSHALIFLIQCAVYDGKNARI